jgi:uncharacterized protein YqjF (DUF2071 family)
MSFLKAEWRKLILVNYEIAPSILQKYIPAHTELDLWNGRCYVSLVGFMFLNTKMLGLKIPFHINFEEVNLRFYVKYNDGNEWKRGVVFIKELVPKPAIAIVANTLYKEHYQALPMRHQWSEDEKSRSVTYEWKYKNHWQSVSVQADLNSQLIEKGSETEFITEHYWGYTKINDSKTFEYEVTHPTWKHYPIQSYNIAVDFGLVYGDDFVVLNRIQPASVMLAEGSLITVEQVHKI